MSASARRVVYWAPRVLSIAFIAFLSLFALDAIGEGRGVWETAVGLAVHLIPAFLLIGVLALAWRWEWVGAAVFGAAGVTYVFQTMQREMPAGVKMSWILSIAGPALLIAGLFLVNWVMRSGTRRSC